MHEISDPPKNTKMKPKVVPKGSPNEPEIASKLPFVIFVEPRGLKKEAPGAFSKVGPLLGSVWDPQKWRKHRT